MSTYEIFPNTAATGTQIDQDTSDITHTTCRRFCDDLVDCEAFIWNDTPETCTLLSNVGTQLNIKGSTTYVKKGHPSYWLLWLLVGGLLFILFLNKCRR